VLQTRGIDLVSDHGHVEERRRHALSLDHPCLLQVKTAGPRQNDGLALVDGDFSIALFVLVGELGPQGGDDVVDALDDVRPGIGDRVFQVQHHAGSPGIQHLDHELGVVGRPRHLVALILTPAGQRDFPAAGGCLRGRQIVGQPSLVGGLEHAAPCWRGENARCRGSRNS